MFKAALIVGLLLAALLTLFPHLDLLASRPFYDVPTADFFLGDVLYPVSTAIQAAFDMVPRVTLILLLASFVPALRAILPERRVLIFFLFCIALVPGLIVNQVFKEPFGRARPAKVTEFGGEKQFTGALRISHECVVNCSFVSGDAAGGFTFFGLALTARRRRKLWCGLSLGLGSAVGLVRIAEGRHFLSDIVFAGLITTLTVYFFYWLLIGPLDDDGVRRPFLRSMTLRARKPATLPVA